MAELKPCPFCGETPKVYGRRRRDYVEGVWAEKEGEEYWVKPMCLPVCFLGNTHAHAFGIVDGMKYNTPEAAIKAWNRRNKKMNKWIPVTERLPEEAGEYLCTSRWNKDDNYSVAMLDYGKINPLWKGSDRVFLNGYAFGEDWGGEIDDVEEVIAWMPLPEPYTDGVDKEGEQE